MEVSHVVLRPLPSISGAVFDSRSVKCSLSGVSIDAGFRSSADLRLLGSRDPTDSVRPKRVSGTLNSGFSDAGHLRYYVSSRSGEKKEMEMRNVKKKLKLIKGLTKDLSAFSAMGFDVEAEDGLIGENKGKNISEAAEILLAQLKLLRAEEKELKRKKKEEKAILKATQMKARVDCEESSSSSSESSDGECEKVVDMSCLRSEALTQSKSDEGREAMASSLGPVVVVKSRVETEGIDDQSIQNGRGEICSGIGASSSTVSVVNGKKDQKGLVFGASAERIEVCMGGKCKKSGAAALLEEFQSRVGMEGAVVGCKCMGKCRDGPNVRVLSQVEEGMNGSVTSPKIPLCIGVGLEDVNVIVSNFLGEDRKDMGLMAAV